MLSPPVASLWAWMSLPPLITASTNLAKCIENTFSSISLHGVQILSVQTTVSNVSLPDRGLNAYPNQSNKTSLVCQLTVQYTHPGWNDTINTWIWLPIDTWNGRFLGAGGGGWSAGLTSNLAQPAVEGYASMGTDGGHSQLSTRSDPRSWGWISEENINWPLLHDFSAVALDEGATLGKRATEMFYGSPPKYSYWNGCSTGGRQGHMMAQRFPAQYNGILATAAAINWDKFIVSEYWPQLVMRILNYFPSGCELDALTNSAIRACDGLDGVKDGIIAMPGLCHFDPMTVVGQTVNCNNPSGTIIITEKGARIASAAWAGPTNEAGSSEWYGLNYDSPLSGLVGTQCTSLTDCVPAPFAIATGWLTTFVARKTSLNYTNMTLAEYSRLFRASVNQFGSVIGTRDPDLTDFKVAGGKMVTWHGLMDQLIPSKGTYDYYDRVLALDPNAQDYYRFFPAPGVQHCVGGPGPYPGDAFKSLVDWVEKGIAPDTLRAAATATPTATGGATTAMKAANLCAYPKVFTYIGGDPSLSSSFSCT